MTNTEKTAMIEAITDRHHVVEAAKEDLTCAVVRAVRAGISWAEIGKTLKISKQTAYNRYNTHVETYKRFGEGTSTLTAEDEQKMLDNLYNPEPYTGFLFVRNREWKREPTMARYSCSCGWNVVYPEHEAGEAFDDIAEHEATAHEGIPQEENYGDEEGTQEPEKTAKKIDAPAPAKAKKAAKKIDGKAPAPLKVERTRHAIPIPDTTAQPGTGLGQHTCLNCGISNHKTADNGFAEFNMDCKPTQYDPPKIAYLMWSTNPK